MPGRIRCILRGVSGVACAACVASLGLIAWRGEDWPGCVVLSHPSRLLLLAAMAFLGWYVLGLTREKWKAQVGRLVLVGFSLAISLLAAEKMTRLFLRGHAGRNSLTDLAARSQGLPVKMDGGRHALAEIVRVSTNKLLVYELKPNQGPVPFGAAMLRTNRDGQREDRDYDVAKPEGCIRIVGVGDSGMFGWDVEQGENYLAVLEANLAKRGGANYEVINFAVPGYDTFQEMQTLRTKALAWQPDIVIVGWCENDFGIPFFLLAHDTYSERDTSYFVQLVFHRKYLFRPRVIKHDDVDRSMVDPEILAHVGKEGVRRSLAGLVQLGREQGFKPLMFGPMHSPIRRICGEVGLDYCDTWQALPKGTCPGEFDVHRIHPKPEGHRVLAECLEKELDRRGWLGTGASE